MANDSAPDRRIHAWRDDLADLKLSGVVEARRFVEGRPGWICQPQAAVRQRAEATSPLDTEALFGERVSVFEISDGWAWVQLADDGYVGYIRAEAIREDAFAPTHRVRALATFVYPRADIKAPPTMCLAMGSAVEVTGSDERFAALAGGGFVIARHLSEAGQAARDFVDVAERFIGVPYLWGGRTRYGLDCSGLLQVALMAAGFEAPRDSDMQEKQLGASVLIPESLEGLERGDLVFWPGHVAIMTDGVMLVHANAHHMCVAAEPLTLTAARAKRTGSEISAIKRLPGLGNGG